MHISKLMAILTLSNSDIENSPSVPLVLTSFFEYIDNSTTLIYLYYIDFLKLILYQNLH